MDRTESRGYTYDYNQNGLKLIRNNIRNARRLLSLE